MTTDHTANDHTANGFFDQADQDCIWGHEDDLTAEAELELAGDNLLDTLLDEELAAFL